MQNAPAIIEIAEENETFKSGVFFLCSVDSSSGSAYDWRGVVAQQFKRSWRHTTSCPKVRAVYKVVPAQQSLDKYNAYRCVVTLPSPKILSLHVPNSVIPWNLVATLPA